MLHLTRLVLLMFGLAIMSLTKVTSYWFAFGVRVYIEPATQVTCNYTVLPARPATL